MKGILTALHVLSVLGTLLGAAGGALTLMDTFNSAASAPQQGAGAAMALAMAVIPYVIMRCFSTSLAALDADDTLKALREQLAVLKTPTERR